MNEKVAIVTDSTSDLNQEVIDQYGIYVLPLKVIYPDHKEYLDRIDISPDEIYNRMPEEIPTTSLPSPASILELFKELRSEGYTHVIAIHISSGLSGTYNAVKSMAREFEDMVIEVIDSKALSMGLGMPVLEGAKVLKQTNSFTATLQRIREVMNSMKVFFVVGTLDYLKKGGRIGYVAGTIGEIMQVKPIISINEEGKYYTYDKVRGRKKSLLRLVEIATKSMGNGLVNICVMQGGAEEQETKEVVERIKGLANVKEIYQGQVGPVIGVHTGPGLIGICVNDI